MRLNHALASLCLACASTIGAQPVINPLDWVEDSVPPAPAFSKDALIALNMPPYVSLKVGVDPLTISVGSDGVVRYVVVMRNESGSVNAAFEGIRCTTDEFTTYARAGTSGSWTVVAQPKWRSVTDNMPSRHAHVFARQGACEGRIANSRDEILAALRRGKKFQH